MLKFGLVFWRNESEAQGETERRAE